MKVFDHIPVTLDVVEFIKIQGIRKITEQELSSLIEKACQLMEPKAVYTFLRTLNVDNPKVHVEGGHVLDSVILSDTLRGGQTIAPYVITIGPGVEKLASEEAKKSILKSWILEKVGDYALSKAREYAKSEIEKQMESKVSSFGPGTGTGKLFDIRQQEVLFKILEPQNKIGVKLTPSYLMIPRKSVSGVFASTNTEYVACQYCPRKCESRKKNFSGEYHPIECEHKHP
jgi:hypothetical protein